MAKGSRYPIASNKEPQVRYERQLSVTSIGTLWLGRFLVGSEAGRSVLIRQISKSILPGSDFAPVEQSARAYSLVRHPSFVKLLGAIEQDGDLITLSEHLVGAPYFDVLRDAIDNGTPIAPTVAVRIALDAARATFKAHRLAGDAGLFPTERLFLPESIFLAAFGGTLLTEVGTLSAIARTKSALSIPDVIAQLAPEDLQPHDKSEGSPEVFSLGVLLWETLANRRLFSRDAEAQTRDEVLCRPIPELSTVERFGVPVPEPLVRLVRTATNRNAKERFASLEELILALEQLPAHFIATEHQVAEMLRQQASSLVVRCTSDDSQLVTSGTFSEVPPSRMSTRPPAAAEFEAEKPTFAQRRLITSFQPIDTESPAVPRPEDSAPRHATSNSTATGLTPDAPTYVPSTSLSVPGYSVVPRPTPLHLDQRKVLVAVACCVGLASLSALLYLGFTQHGRAPAPRQARPDTSIVAHPTSPNRWDGTPNPQTAAPVGSPALGIPRGAPETKPNFEGSQKKPVGAASTAPADAATTDPSSRGRTVPPSRSDGRSAPGGVYRPTQIQPYRPKAI